METQNNASEVQDFTARYLATKLKVLEYEKRNLRVLFAAFKAAGIKEATYEYEGRGDSGDYEDMSFYDTDGKLIESAKINALQVEVIEWNHCLVNEPKAVTKPLEEALRYFCYFVIEEAGHVGWENNDGGGGEITFYVSLGEFNLEHYYNVVHREESSHSSDELFDE